MSEFILLDNPVTNERVDVFEQAQLVRAYNQEGTAIVEMTFVDSLLHSIEDRPSYREIDIETNTDRLLQWHKQGVEHREGKPSTLGLSEGKVAYRIWRIAGKSSRLDGPHTEIFNLTYDRVDHLAFGLDGSLFRDDGPCEIDICVKSGIVTSEFWCTKLGVEGAHRTDGPAIVLRDQDTGIVIQQVGMQEGEICPFNDDPPVIVRDRHSGQITYSGWEDKPINQYPKLNL